MDGKKCGGLIYFTTCHKQMFVYSQQYVCVTTSCCRCRISSRKNGCRSSFWVLVKYLWSSITCCCTHLVRGMQGCIRTNPNSTEIIFRRISRIRWNWMRTSPRFLKEFLYQPRKVEQDENTRWKDGKAEWGQLKNFWKHF